MALRLLAARSRSVFGQTRSMTILATTNTSVDTTGMSFPAPPMISAQREVLLEILAEKLYWMNPESLVTYTDEDFKKADVEYSRLEKSLKEEILATFEESVQADAIAAIIPTHPWKRMEKINGKTLKVAFPYLFE